MRCGLAPTESPMTQPLASRARVWDLPIRIGHGLMVLLVALSWWSAEQRHMDYHRYAGYAMLGLLLFRVYWGFAGSRTARFAQFVRGPRATLAYVRGKANGSSAGHNPLGAWSVLLLLALLAAMVGLGLFAVDVDGLESGPLSDYVSFETGRACAHWHHRVFTALQAMIALHVLAVLYYELRRGKRLIAAMIHGRADMPGSEAIESAGVLRLAIGLALAAAAVWLVAR